GSARVGLGESAARIGVPGFEPGRRRPEALAGIGSHQRQTAERGFDDPPQAVVEAHRGEVGRRGADDRATRCGVDQLVGRLTNENPLLVGAEKEPPLLQRADDLRSKGIAARGDCIDALDGLVETVGGETEKPILVRPGAHRRRQGGEHAERADERDEAIAEGTHSIVPAFTSEAAQNSGSPPALLRAPAMSRCHSPGDSHSLNGRGSPPSYARNSTKHRHRIFWSRCCSFRISASPSRLPDLWSRAGTWTRHRLAPGSASSKRRRTGRLHVPRRYRPAW